MQAIAPTSKLILMESQLAQYIPILMLGALVTTFALGTLLASALLGKTGFRSRIKDTAYECGMLPMGEGSARFSVKFYLVAMLFILFDVEVVFLYPWAVVYKDMLAEHAHLIFGSMMLFLLLFLVGFVYEIKKKAFDWKS